MRRYFSKQERLFLLSLTGKCEYCGIAITPDQRFHVDHIIPFSKGGTTCLDNAAVTCVNCNSSKGNRSCPTKM